MSQPKARLAALPIRPSAALTAVRPGLVPAVLSAAVTAAAWAAWLGWDRVRDDGTGPYQAWQVAGLVAVLVATWIVTTLRGHATAATAGPAVGVAVAAVWDWSGDGGVLWIIGAALIVGGTLLAGMAVTSLTWIFRPAGDTSAA